MSTNTQIEAVKETENVKFTPIDLESWYRSEMFTYFSQMAPTTYSITVNVDVTNMRKVLKENKLKFFPAYLWIVTKHLNEQTEFKIARKDGQLGYYDYLNPLYAVFHEDDTSFSTLWMEYTDDFRAFHAQYLIDQEKYKNNHGLVARPELPPPNICNVSCVPWFSFQSVSMRNDVGEFYYPIVEAGKFIEQDEKTLMPLSITGNHASTDGYHIHVFLDALQESLNDFGKYL